MRSVSRFPARSLAVVAAMAASAATLTAQAATPQGGSILYLLETEGRLEVGGEVRGALSSSDYLSIRDSYLDAWLLQATGGTRVTIDLMSDELDTYLYLVGPGFAETISDDDGGGGCNARITVTLLEDGMFRVVASSTGNRQTGVYTLRVSEGDVGGPSYRCGGINPEMFLSLSTEGRNVAFGDTADGRLTSADRRMEGRPVQAWTLQGVAGQSVSVMLLSDDFDPYLYLLGPGLAEPLSDDDGAGDLDSKIDITFPETGTYTLVASALSRGGTGQYTIMVIESRNVGDLAELETEGRQIVLDEPALGFLTNSDAFYDGRPVQAWAFEGESGMRVEVTLVSDDFDTYLYMIGPGIRRALSDDDGAGDLDSRIVTTLQETGTFIIVAAGYSGGASGGYELTVTTRPSRPTRQ